MTYSDNMSDTAYCTIVTKSHLAYARALGACLAKHDPKSKYYVLLADRVDGYFNPDKEPFELITLDQLSDQEDIHKMSFYYNAIEMCFVLRPWLHEYMTQNTPFKKWIYLDADIAVYNSLQVISDQLNVDTSILLSPHLININPPPSADIKSIRALEASLLRSGGIYQGGFLALQRSEESHAFVNWFKERLLFYGFNERPMQSGDQFWMTYIPLYFNNVSVSKDPGANLAYWNLFERTISEDNTGYVKVNNEPLLFIHFAGYDMSAPNKLTKYSMPQKLSGVPEAINKLASDYHSSLIDSGYNETIKYPYAFDKFNNGSKVTPLMRRLYFNIIFSGKSFNGSPFNQYDFFKSRIRLQELKVSFRKTGRRLIDRIKKLLNPDYDYKAL